MQASIDFLVKFWMIVIPLALAVTLIVGFLVKKGRLESLDIFGIKISFNRDEKILSSVPDKGLRDHDIKFSKTAQGNISTLKLTEDKVIELIGSEFTHHVNYFKWDLQDYPLPVQQNYIVVLDKTGKSLTIRAVKSSNMDEAQLTSINNLLADYRRLSRYKYRTAQDYVMRPETIKAIKDSHIGVIKLLYKHYALYKEPGYDSDAFWVAYLGYEMLIKQYPDSPKMPEILDHQDKVLPKDRVFAHNLISAVRALQGITPLLEDLDNGLITSVVADREIVLSLERSLQYIHKTVNHLLAD